MDDIGIATKTPEELLGEEIEFLGGTISPLGVASQNHKRQNYLKTLKFPRTKKGLQWYIEFVNFYKNYNQRLSEKIVPFHELIKSDKPAKKDQELIRNFEAVKQITGQRLWPLAQTTTAKPAVPIDDWCKV